MLAASGKLSKPKSVMKPMSGRGTSRVPVDLVT